MAGSDGAEGDRILRITYLVNGLDYGGAERGIGFLAEHGFFAGASLRVVAFIEGSGRLRAELARINPAIEVVSFGSERHWNIRVLARSLPRLIGEFWRTRPDIVLLSLPQANILGRLGLVLFPRILCVTFEHSTRLSSPLYFWLLLVTSPRVDVVLGDSWATLRAMRRWRLPRRRHYFWVPLFEASGCMPEKMNHAIHGVVRMLSTGRLVPLKNFDLGIRVVAALRRAGLRVEYTICGEGPEMGRLQALAVELGVADAVHLPGFVRDWQAHAAAYDIFLHPSAYEGLSLTVLEAMEVGLPVIASAVGGIADYGRHDQNLYFVQQPSEASLAEAIRTLVADEALRARLGRQAAQDARELFGPGPVGSLLRRARSGIDVLLSVPAGSRTQDVVESGRERLETCTLACCSSRLEGHAIGSGKTGSGRGHDAGGRLPSPVRDDGRTACCPGRDS